MKRGDSEVVSTSSGSSRSSDHRKGSTFNLRRLFQFRRLRKRSKSRVSLDSDSCRSEVSLSVAHSGSVNTVQSNTVPSNTVQSNTVQSNTVQSNPHAAILYVPPTQPAYCPPRPPHALPGGGGRGGLRECPVCLIELERDQFPEVMTCEHRTCGDCLRRYLQIEISESRVNVTCPECAERLHPNDIRVILQDDTLMRKYEQFMLRRVLVMDPDARWCPAPDCGLVRHLHN